MNLGSKLSFVNSESVNDSVGKKNTLKGQGKQKQTQPISIPTPLYAFLYIDRMTLYYSIWVTEFWLLCIRNWVPIFSTSQCIKGMFICLHHQVPWLLFSNSASPIIQKCMHSLWESETYKTKCSNSFTIKAFSHLMYHSLSQ